MRRPEESEETTSKGLEWVGEREMAQSPRFLPCNGEAPSLMPRIYVKKMLSTVMCAYDTWRVGQTDSCGLLARKPYLLSES